MILQKSLILRVFIVDPIPYERKGAKSKQASFLYRTALFVDRVLVFCDFSPLKCQPHKMVKHTFGQTRPFYGAQSGIEKKMFRRNQEKSGFEYLSLFFVKRFIQTFP